MEHFEKKIIEQLDALKSSIISASNIYWRCDPAKHVKDTTYLEVTQLLQVKHINNYLNNLIIIIIVE